MQQIKFWAAGRVVAAAILVLTVVMLTPPAGGSTYKSLYKFTGGADGGQAWGTLVLDAVGNLYGTTWDGGAYGAGTVFQLARNPDGSWTETVLYSFTGGSDGGFLNHESLILDAEGALYGTTSLGGVQGCNYGGPGPGCGVVFKLTPSLDGSWTQSVLYSFTGGNDGGYPAAGVTFDTAGSLYGKTQRGGGTGCPSQPGCGVVYKLSPNPDGSWAQSTIHSFTGYGDGSLPDAGSLVFDPAGNLYGTAELGGERGCGDYRGCGVVFELIPDPDGSWKEKALHQFTGGKDGGWPEGNLVFDADGNLYGTTWLGGVYGYGTAYELTPNPDGSWAGKVLHQFRGGKDGANLYAGLVFNAQGTLYGTTTFGGANGCGTIFRLMPKPDGTWREHLVHTFAARPAAYPNSEVIFDGAGNLYGTTSGAWGGAAVVYESTP